MAAGTAWTQVPVSYAAQNTLFAVKGLSPTDAWAVGSTGTGQILVLHWNGTAWIQAATPNLNGQLTAVSALSPTDAWAVGLGGSGSTQSLVLHWDGTSWTRQRSPNPAGTSTGKFNDLNGVAAVSATDAWAVGTYGHQGLMTPAGKPLVLHWDGTSWTQAKAPFFGGFSGLGGVSAVSATNVWAVGSVNSGPQFIPTTLILHWNGTAWTRS